MNQRGDRLTEVLERLANQPMLPVPDPQFRAPSTTNRRQTVFYLPA